MPLTWLGGGMDKQYFWEVGADYGWLETSEAVKAREQAAWIKLKALVPDNIPDIKEDTAPAVLIKDDGTEIEGKCGYWVQHIPHRKTFKPAMCAMMVMRPVRVDVIANLTPDAQERMAASLESVKEQLVAICAVVGELSIAVHSLTGQAYLIDYAPNESGDVGGEDLRLTAEKGIDNVVLKLNE